MYAKVARRDNDEVGDKASHRRHRARIVPFTRLRPISASFSSVGGLNRGERNTEYVKEHVVPPHVAPQSDGYVIVEGKGPRAGKRKGENDEGRESARGMEAARTENQVILPACY